MSDSKNCPALCTQEVCRTFNECKQTLSDSISTQMLIESSKEERPRTPEQKCDFGNITTEVPHNVRSLLPPNNNIRTISPTHLVIFPPEIPAEYRIYSRSRTSTPQPKHDINFEADSKNTISSDVCQVESTISKTTIECLEVVEPNYVPKIDEHEDAKTETCDTIQDQPTISVSTIELAVKQKLPISETAEDRAESPMVVALKTAPERSYSPLPSFVDASEFIPKPIEPVDEEKPMSMAEALAIAPERCYKLPEIKTQSRPVGNNPVRYMHGYNKKTPPEPLLMTRTLMYTPASAVDSEEEQIAILGLKSFPPVSDELKWSTAAGDFDRAEQNFEYGEELVFDEPEIEETPQEPIFEEETVIKETLKLLPKHPFTASGLHEPSDIPRYQQSIPENPHRATPSDKSSGKLVGPGIKDKVSTFTPKDSIKNTSFLKQESNVHTKVAPALGYEPSSLEGGPSKCKNANKIIEKSEIAEPRSCNAAVATCPKSTPVLQPPKESISSLTHNNSVANDTLVEPVAPFPKTSLTSALLSKKLTCFTKKQQPKCIPTPVPEPDLGGQPTGRTGASAGLTVPRRGRGVLNPQNLTPGARVPLCGQCNLYIR